MKSLTEKGSLLKRKPTYSPEQICTGFGIAEQVPVRTAAYTLPGIQAGKEYPEAQVEAYVATKFAVRLNACNPQTVKTNAQLIQEYSALVKEKIALKTKPINWLEEQDPFEEKRKTVLVSWAQTLREKAPKEVIEFADRRNGDQSLEYMAAHSLYMWDPVDAPLNTFITRRNQPPTNLMMIGGPAEEIFCKARKAIMESYSLPGWEGWWSEQAFTPIGRKPSYIPTKQDVNIGKKDRPEINLETIQAIGDPDVQRDLYYLVIGLTETLCFTDVKRARKDQLNPQETEDLRAACGRLEEMVRQLES